MAGEEGSNPRLHILRRAVTLDESGCGYGPPSLGYFDAGARRARGSPLATNEKKTEDMECDSLEFPEDGRGARASSDSVHYRGKSLFVESPPGSSALSQQTDLPTAGRFGWGFMRNSKEKRSRGSGIFAALNAVGWRGGSGSTPEPNASQTPVCTPPSSSETLSTPQQTGFVKLAPWTRNRAKTFLTTPKLMRNSRRTSWGNRNPKITPDMCTESEETCPPSSSTPSSSPPSCDESSEEPEFLSLPPRRNSRAPDPPGKCLTPESSPPRMSRLKIDSVNGLSEQSASKDQSPVDVGDMRMVGAKREADEAEMRGRTTSDVTLLSTVSSSRSFSDSSAQSLTMAMDEAVAGREDGAGAELPRMGIRSIAEGERGAPRVRRPRGSRQRVRFLQPSPKTYVAKESSGHARGRGGDGAVARLRELIAEDRGWPWAGRRIIGVQYVSIGGQHRWIRSEGCRNAILLVTGAMFLLELPVDALSGQDAGKEVHQNPDVPPPRGWYVKIDARTLKSISVPMGSEEVDLWANEANFGRPHNSSQVRTDHGVIFHTRTGACLWVNCGNGVSRDSLVRTVAMWHISETKTSVLDLRHMPRAEAETSMRSGQGGVVRSLLSERKSCLYRSNSPP